LNLMPLSILRLMKKIFLILLISLGSYAGHSQLDNTAFDQLQPIVADDSNALFIGVNALGFNKNNEYFNDIADGFTLFGFQFKMEIRRIRKIFFINRNIERGIKLSGQIIKIFNPAIY
ncbi:MAG: hypothetical protein AAFX57_14595, partial [Bacteroidota bacterium]